MYLEHPTLDSIIHIFMKGPCIVYPKITEKTCLSFSNQQLQISTIALHIYQSHQWCTQHTRQPWQNKLDTTSCLTLCRLLDIKEARRLGYTGLFHSGESAKYVGCVGVRGGGPGL